MSDWLPEPEESRITADIYSGGEWERRVTFPRLNRGDIIKFVACDGDYHIHPVTHEPDEDVMAVVDGLVEECLERMRGYQVPILVFDSLEEAIRARAS